MRRRPDSPTHQDSKPVYGLVANLPRSGKVAWSGESPDRCARAPARRTKLLRRPLRPPRPMHRSCDASRILLRPPAPPSAAALGRPPLRQRELGRSCRAGRPVPAGGERTRARGRDAARLAGARALPQLDLRVAERTQSRQQSRRRCRSTARRRSGARALAVRGYPTADERGATPASVSHAQRMPPARPAPRGSRPAPAAGCQRSRRPLRRLPAARLPDLRGPNPT